MKNLNSKLVRAAFMTTCALPERSKDAFFNILDDSVMSTIDADGRLSAVIFPSDIDTRRTWLFMEQDVPCLSGFDAKVLQAVYVSTGATVYMEVYAHTLFDILENRVVSKGNYLIRLYTLDVNTITDNDKLGGWLEKYDEQSYVSTIREVLHDDIEKSNMSKNVMSHIKDITDVFLTDLHLKLDIPSNGATYQHIGSPHAYIKQVVLGIIVDPLTGLRMVAVIAYTLAGTFIFHGHDDGDRIYHGAFHSKYAQHVYSVK